MIIPGTTTILPIMLRELQSNMVGRIVVVPGIITQTSKSQIRASKAVYVCTTCGHEYSTTVKSGFSRVMAPSICIENKGVRVGEKCGLNSYRMATERCEFID